MAPGLLFLALGSGVVWLMNRTNNLNNLSEMLSYKLGVPKITNWGLTDFTLNVPFSIVNRSTTEFTFKGIIGKAYYKGNQISEYNTFGTPQVNIKANGTATIPLRLTIPYLSFGSAVISLLKNKLAAKKTSKAAAKKSTQKTPTKKIGVTVSDVSLRKAYDTTPATNSQNALAEPIIMKSVVSISQLTIPIEQKISF